MADALKKLDGKKINLIISDVNMPNMDGISFVKEAKKLASYKFTPVIMLTTESQDSKKQEGQAAGAKAWGSSRFSRTRCWLPSPSSSCPESEAFMPLHIETGKEKTVVAIAGEMTIYTAAELKQALTPLLYRQQELELIFPRSAKWTVPVCNCCWPPRRRHCRAAIRCIWSCTAMRYSMPLSCASWQPSSAIPPSSPTPITPSRFHGQGVIREHQS